MMSTIIMIGCLLMGLLAAVLCLRHAGRCFSIRRLIVDTPTTQIDKLSSGLREVKGRIVLQDEGKLAPFSNERVAYYDFRVLEHRTEGNSSHMETLVEDTYFAEVALDDGTGLLKLEWDSAELQLLPGHTMQVGLFDKKVPVDLQERLQRLYDYNTKGLVFDKSSRYKEKTLAAGCELYAIGRVSLGEDGFVMNAAGPTFVIGDQDESEVAFKYARSGVFFSVGAVLALAAGGAVAWLVLQINGG